MKNNLFLTTAIVAATFMALPVKAEPITERQEITTDTSFLTDVTADSISGGYQGGVIENSAQTSFGGTTEFTNNSAERAGGAINNTGTLVFDKSATFTSNNTTNGAGGAVSNSGTITFNDKVTFSNNSATATTPSAAYGIGGSIYNQGTITFEKLATFSGNKATEYGNAIHNDTSGIMNFKGGLVSTNNSSADGYVATNGISNNGIMSVIGGDITIIENTAYSGAGITSANNNSKLYLGAYLNNLDEVVEAPVDKITFANNKTTNTTAGALYTAGEGKLYANTITFDSNSNQNNGSSGAYAGAIAQQGGTLDIIGNTNNFTNNHANATTTIEADKYKFGGGAIQASNGSILVIGKNSSENIFSGNTSAMNGGAILTRKTTTNVTINGNTTFSNNTANLLGGAIYNYDSAITFNDRTVFEGNTDSMGANDIYNEGSIVFNGDVTFDGGITGETGTVTFKEGKTVNVKTGKTTIDNKVTTNGANLKLTFDNGFSGRYELVKNNGIQDKEFTIVNNALYNINKSDTKGTYNISKKSGIEIAAETGATQNQASTITAITGGEGNNTVFNTIANSINDLMQSNDTADIQMALEAAETFAPNVAPVTTQTANETTSQVFNAVSTRMSGGSATPSIKGISSGDMRFDNNAVWAQGLYNHAKLDDTHKVRGYKADSGGMAFGFEKQLTSEIKAGIGYAYTHTDIDGHYRDLDVDTHTALIYGEYKPSAWFINTVASYSWSKYDEDKKILGYKITGDYDSQAFALQSMTGYDMAYDNTILTPEAGLRYIHISPKGYRDITGQYIYGSKGDTFTGILGMRAEQAYALDNGWTLHPQARLAYTYDIANDDGSSTVSLANGAAYTINGEPLKRSGIEADFTLMADISDSVSISAGYQGKFRNHYDDHTGLLNFKYNF